MGIVVDVGFAVFASTPAERNVPEPAKIVRVCVEAVFVRVKVAACVEAVFVVLVDPGRGLADVVVAVVDVVDAVCVDIAVLARYRDVAVRLWSLSQPNEKDKYETTIPEKGKDLLSLHSPETVQHQMDRCSRNKCLVCSVATENKTQSQRTTETERGGI